MISHPFGSLSSNRRFTKPSSWARSLSLFCCLLAILSAPAEGLGLTLPQGGKDLLPTASNGGAQAYLPKDPDVATAKVVQSSDAPWAEFWRVNILKRPTNSWDAQLSAKVSGPITKGDKCLLLFYVRAVEGEASGAAAVEVRNPPDYPKLGSTQFRAGTQWREILLPFIASENGPDGKCAVSIHLGGEVQKVDVGGLRLLNYGPNFPFEKLPQQKFSYEGREPDAAWRKEAFDRIEKHRKGEFTFAVVDSSGKPVPDAEVRAVLKRHAFGFGSAVTAKMLADTSTDGEHYRRIVDECFSRVVFENDMKPDPWRVANEQKDDTTFRKAWVDQSLTWLAERDFSVRGHYLCWAPFESWSTALKDQPQAIREKVLANMRVITSATNGRVHEWDALNHPAGWEANSCINRVLGDEFYAEVFNQARKLTNVPLWINEDQVFRPGRQQDEYYEIIKNLIASGVKIDGLGNQAHFHSSFLPSPVEMLANSDRFAALVPALQITEFDLNTNGDEQLAADFTRDILITTFSHPAYTGFVLWGFWEGAHWLPETALWRKDWSEKPAAKVWRDLVCRQWHTDAHIKTDAQGSASLRGFFGRYEITVKTGAISQSFDASFTHSNLQPLKLVLEVK